MAKEPAPAKSGSMLGARTVMELQRITDKRRARDMREIREELKAIRELLSFAPIAFQIPSPAAAGTAASNTPRGSLFRRLADWWR